MTFHFVLFFIGNFCTSFFSFCNYNCDYLSTYVMLYKLLIYGSNKSVLWTSGVGFFFTESSIIHTRNAPSATFVGLHTCAEYFEFDGDEISGFFGGCASAS